MPFALRGLDDVDWAAIPAGNGPATEVPALLRALASRPAVPLDPVLRNLGESLCHQRTTWPVTAAAVPFVFQLVGPGSPADKAELLLLLGRIARGRPARDDAEDPRLAVRRGLGLVIELLSDPDPEIRAAAMSAATACPEDADRVRPALERSARSDDREWVRAVALQTLGSLVGPAPREILDAGLASSHRLLRWTAARWLLIRDGRDAPPAAIDAVAAVASGSASDGVLVGDESPYEIVWFDDPRTDSLAALGGLDAPRLEALCARWCAELVSGRDPWGRGSRARSLLDLAFSDDSSPLQRRVIEALAAMEFDEEWIPDLKGYLLPTSREGLTAWLASAPSPSDAWLPAVDAERPFGHLPEPPDLAQGDRYFLRDWVLPLLRAVHTDAGTPAVVEGARRATDGVVRGLLGMRQWRSRVVGAHVVAVAGLGAYEQTLANLLLRSDYCIAGRHYALALASFGTPVAVGALEEYLDYYLRRLDLRYDQVEVMAALRWLDRSTGADRASRWVEAWRAYASTLSSSNTIERADRRFEVSMARLLSRRQALGRGG